MVVEDDPKTLEVITEALNSFGAKTIACRSVTEAFSTFDKFKPNILVSDIAMPGEDGYSLIRKVRKLSPEQGGSIPSLAMPIKEDVKRALSAGFDSQIAKPFGMFHPGREVANLARQRKEVQS